MAYTAKNIIKEDQEMTHVWRMLLFYADMDGVMVDPELMKWV